MVSSLSNLVNNLSEVINKTKCKYRHDDKKCEACGNEYTNFKNGLIQYKHLCYNKR